jgi:hypothetical protein
MESCRALTCNTIGSPNRTQKRKLTDNKQEKQKKKREKRKYQHEALVVVVVLSNLFVLASQFVLIFIWVLGGQG